MAAAKRRGRKFGRPRKLTNAKVKWARQALKGQQAMTFRKFVAAAPTKVEVS